MLHNGMMCQRFECCVCLCREESQETISLLEESVRGLEVERDGLKSQLQTALEARQEQGKVTHTHTHTQETISLLEESVLCVCVCVCVCYLALLLSRL